MSDKDNQNIDEQPTLQDEVGNSELLNTNDLVDYKDKYARLLAEYSNFVKQKDAELSSMAKFANKNLLSKLLDIVDAIEAGLMQESVTEETKGILNILNIKVLQIMAMEGVLEIEFNSGDAFDPEKCEVIQTIEEKDFSGKIIQVLRKGYTLSDRVLRTAKVIVGK